MAWLDFTPRPLSAGGRSRAELDAQLDNLDKTFWWYVRHNTPMPSDGIVTASQAARLPKSVGNPDWHDGGNINPPSRQTAPANDLAAQTPYQQITGTAPAPKLAASKPKATPKKQAPAATSTPPKSVGNPDWHDAGNSIPAQNYVNAMPVQRSAGMSPDTSYD